jgi:hypothetical protein
LRRSGRLLAPPVRADRLAAAVDVDEEAVVRGCRLCGHQPLIVGDAFCRGRDVACYAEARARLGMGRTVGLWKRNDVARLRAGRRMRRAA